MASGALGLKNHIVKWELMYSEGKVKGNLPMTFPVALTMILYSQENEKKYRLNAIVSKNSALIWITIATFYCKYE